MAPVMRRMLPGPILRPDRYQRHQRQLRRVGCVLIALMLLLAAMAASGAYLFFFQAELFAWMIVGALLSIVFGTPFLCVVALFVFYIRAIAHIGQVRYRTRPASIGRTDAVSQTIVVGEVVFDE